jgi:hypothetical protein
MEVLPVLLVCRCCGWGVLLLLLLVVVVVVVVVVRLMLMRVRVRVLVPVWWQSLLALQEQVTAVRVLSYVVQTGAAVQQRHTTAEATVLLTGQSTEAERESERETEMRTEEGSLPPFADVSIFMLEGYGWRGTAHFYRYTCVPHRLQCLDAIYSANR